MYPPLFFPLPLLLFVAEMAEGDPRYRRIPPSARLTGYLSAKKEPEWKHVSVQSREEGKVCPRWQIAQTPVKLHAGQRRNNGLIKERLSTAGSSRVLGSCVGRNEWESGLLFLLIKFRSRRLTESGIGRGERTFPIILAAGSNSVDCRRPADRDTHQAADIARRYQSRGSPYRAEALQRKERVSVFSARSLLCWNKVPVCFPRNVPCRLLNRANKAQG